MGKKLPEKTSLAPVDNSSDELFASLKGLEEKSESKLSLSYIPSFFTTASLPFKNINKTEFVRKGSNGISLILNSPKNVPFGKYGRLLLSVFTTHAVISKIKDAPVEIEFESLSQLLREMQLPRQRGQDIQEQLECFKKATFSFEQKVEKQEQAYLFKNLYGPDEKLPKRDVTVRTTSTGTILFTEGVQYQEIFDEKSKNPRIGKFKIILSANFAHFCQQHGVPINYTVYKDISSPVGKDIYAWLVYRNNCMEENGEIFIPRKSLIEQFVISNNSESKESNERVGYLRIIEQIRIIKEKYYPGLKVNIDSHGDGITLLKSPPVIEEKDKRYILITQDILGIE